MASVDSKHALLSQTIGLALATIGLAIFSIVQDAHAGGLAAVSETDVGIILTGIGLVINRALDKNARPLRLRRKSAADSKTRKEPDGD